MILAIDVGNTNIVLGLIEDGNIRNIFHYFFSIHNRQDSFFIKSCNMKIRICLIFRNSN